MRKIVIWGEDGYNALGLLRQLTGHECKLFLLVNGKIKRCATASTYCDGYAVVDNTEQGVQYLLKQFNNEDLKPVLYTTGDLFAEAVDKHKEQLEKLFYVMGTEKQGHLTEMDDKLVMLALAEECGFTIPRSVRCTKNTIVTPRFPCLLKPYKHVEGKPTEFKTKICKNEKEFEDTIDRISEESVFVLQDYINKTKDVLIYGCRLNSGYVVLAGAFIKDRWLYGADGSHGVLSSSIPDSVNQNAIEKFLGEISYHGLFSVEYGLCDNKAYFYEFNLRNDGTSHYFYQAGVNLPLLWLEDCIGKINEKDKTCIQGVHYFIDEIGDLSNVLTGRVHYSQWKIERKQATVFKFFDKHDPAPWRFQNKKKYFRLAFYHLMANTTWMRKIWSKIR